MTMMIKNLYRCDTCQAQIIAQAPRGWVTPMFLRCRVEGCKGMSSSSMFSLVQDVLADAHVEFTYEGVKEGYGPSDARNLRPVPPFKKSFP